MEIEDIRVVPELDRASIVVDKFYFGAAEQTIAGDVLLRRYADKPSAALSAYSTASLATPFIVASGETLVIGTSQVSDYSELGDAVIIVVTATVLE